MAELKTTLDYARWYVSKGFSVIPLKPKSKIPALDSWKEFQTRRPTDEELNKWFGNGSNNNIGIVTGKISGLAVIDFDSQKAVQFAKDNNFPQTPLVKTAKGYHAYCKSKDGVSNFQKRDDLPDIDLRAAGGYVVAPPSIHESGNPYHWIEGKGLNDIPFADLPEIILTQRPEHKTPLKQLYNGVAQGNRNDTLARLTGSWVNDSLSLMECIENALLWNQKNRPALPEREVERTVKSIYEKHHRELSNCPDIGSRQTDTSKINPLLFLKKGSDLQSLECQIEWAIDKLLPKQSITLLHGKGGIGKTWLCLIMADSISKGNQFMTLITQEMPVVFIDFENSLPVLVDRVKKIGIEDVLFWHNANEILRPSKLDKPEWEYYKSLPTGLLIFDTLRASQGQDENDSQKMAFIMSRLKELRDMGFTILLLHHTPKSNDRTYKGSTAILDLADHVLSLHKVRKTNPEGGEIDDEDDHNCYYRLGTKDKTRYEPFHIFMSFDKERGFIKASDPDEEYLQAIHEILKGRDRLNQKQIFEIVKDELDIKSKGKFSSFLRKGEDKYWTSYRVKNAVYYEAIGSSQVSTPIYQTDGHFSEDSIRTVQTDNNTDTLKLPDNSQVPKCPAMPQTVRTDEVIEVLEVSE